MDFIEGNDMDVNRNKAKVRSDWQASRSTLYACRFKQNFRMYTNFWRTPEPLFSTRQHHRSKQSIVFHNIPDIAKTKERLT